MTRQIPNALGSGAADDRSRPFAALQDRPGTGGEDQKAGIGPTGGMRPGPDLHEYSGDGSPDSARVNATARRTSGCRASNEDADQVLAVAKTLRSASTRAAPLRVRKSGGPLCDTWADTSPAAPPYADVLGSVAEFARQPIRAGARNFLMVQVECKY
jgi:hypothetical protein